MKKLLDPRRSLRSAMIIKTYFSHIQAENSLEPGELGETRPKKKRLLRQDVRVKSEAGFIFSVGVVGWNTEERKTWHSFDQAGFLVPEKVHVLGKFYKKSFR